MQEEEELCEYELIRKRSIEENRRMLQALGLLPKFYKEAPILKDGAKTVVKRRVPARPKKVAIPDEGTETKARRRSSLRLKGIKADSVELPEFDEPDDDSPDSKRTRVKRPNSYGSIEGVEVGRMWLTRLECSSDGVHRPTVAGIHAGPEGAYSIALSGGYDDDVDLGESLTYTGSGGRDLKGTKANPKNLRTALQSKDQTLNVMNASLVKSIETKNPVRVIRGYKLPSAFAPEEGYRYDGLYIVQKYWLSPGNSGFITYKFALSRIVDQPAPPWTRPSNALTQPTNDEETPSNGIDH